MSRKKIPLSGLAALSPYHLVSLSPCRLVLGAILLLALGLRLANNSFGIPDYFHLDERFKVQVILHFFEDRTLDPEYFLHPGFMLYTAAGLAALGNLVFGWPLTAETILMVGRTWIAVLGTITVLVVFFLVRDVMAAVLQGRSRHDEDQPAPTASGQEAIATLAGLAAALFLAVCPLHVVVCHYLKEDAVLTLWTTLSALFCVRLAQSGGRRDYVLAVLCAGLACASKYTGLLSLVLVGVAHVFYQRNQPVKDRSPLSCQVQRGVQLVLAAAAVFLAVNPFSLTNADFRKHARSEFHHAFQYGHQVQVSPWEHAWSFHLRHSLAPGMTLPLLGAGLGGLLLLLRAGRPEARMIVAAALAFYLVHEAAYLKPPPNYERYMTPVLPFLCSAAAVLLFRFGRSHGAAGRAYLLPALALVTAAGLALSPLQRSLALVQDMDPDTRISAGEWCAATLPPDAVVLREISRYSIPKRYVEHCRLLGLPTTLPTEEGRLPIDIASGWYSQDDARLQVDYVITSSMWSDRFFQAGADLSRMRVWRDFYEKLDALWGPPIAIFQSATGTYAFHNPIIKVYRRPGSAVGNCRLRLRG